MRILFIGDKLAKSGDVSNLLRVMNAFAKLGHKTRQIEFSGLYYFLRNLREFDIVFGVNSFFYDECLHLIKLVSEYKGNAKFIVWSFDSCSRNDKWSTAMYQKTKWALPYIDYLITTDNHYKWQTVFANYLHLFQGVDPDDFNYPVTSQLNGRKHDVIFTGGLRRGRYKQRNNIIKKIAKNFSIVIYGSHFNREVMRKFPKAVCKDLIFGKKFFKAHQLAKVCFVPRHIKDISNYWSNRIYLAAATGSCCVAEYVPGLEREFEENKEAIFSNSDQDTIEKIRYLLAHPKERESIGLAARERVLNEYKYVDRVQKMLEIL